MRKYNLTFNPTTLEAVKKHLDIPPDGTSQDAVLEELIRKASLDIEQWCGREFDLRQYIETIQIAASSENIWLVRLKDLPSRRCHRTGRATIL